jgi:hypothetical protein
MVFRIDDIMFVGPYFSSKPSKATPTYEIKNEKDAWLFNDYQNEFNNLWEKAVIV